MRNAALMDKTTQASTSSSGQAGDTTLAIATPAPFSSDGPTLPIIAGASEHAAAHAGNGSESVRIGPIIPQSAAKDDVKPEQRATKKRKITAKTTTSTPPNHPLKIDLSPLRTPWLLLPPELRRLIEARLKLGSTTRGWEACCVSVVISKNQNVRAGVNRLKALLGFERHSDAGTEVPEMMGKKEAMVVVSGMGEGTVKVVGIVELVRRIVGVGEGEEDQAGGGRVVEWYVYTVLSSLVVERGGKGGKGDGEAETVGGQEEGGGEEERDFEDRHGEGDVRHTEVMSRKVPVLMVWMCRNRIPEFADAFGEQVWRVKTIEEE